MAIRFNLDENIPRNAEFLLAGMGHDVDTVRDEHLVGQPDDRILACCIEETRVLVTLDLDFPTYTPTRPARTRVSGSCGRIRKMPFRSLNC